MPVYQLQVATIVEFYAENEDIAIDMVDKITDNIVESNVYPTMAHVVKRIEVD